jgi:hypothetical protein
MHILPEDKGHCIGNGFDILDKLLQIKSLIKPKLKVYNGLGKACHKVKPKFKVYTNDPASKYYNLYGE